MTARVLIVVACVLLAGCAGFTLPGTPPTLLERADAQLIEGNYAAAATSYDEFAAANPLDGSSRRARATKDALRRLLAAQAEIERLQRDVAPVQAERERLRVDRERLQRDLATRQGEIDRLKADLERLRDIDVRDQKRQR